MLALLEILGEASLLVLQILIDFFAWRASRNDD
jgi:hypothetical protein